MIFAFWSGRIGGGGGGGGGGEPGNEAKLYHNHPTDAVYRFAPHKF